MPAMAEAPGPSLRVAALWVYPVKSCRGVAVESMELGPMGPEGDRRFMIAGEDGRFLSQRSLPRMTLIRTAPLAGGGVRLAWEGDVLEIPFPEAGETREVAVWNDRVQALDCGETAASWLRERLGVPCRLVAFPESGRRLRQGGEVRSTAFADAEPVLVTSEASLEEVNSVLERPAPMERFRPNLVVGGAAAWEEDGWRVLDVGGAVLEITRPCARCAIVAVDPETGARDTAPLKALAGMRRWDGEVWFGQNARVAVPGRVRLGDPVRVAASRSRGASGRVDSPDRG